MNTPQKIKSNFVFRLLQEVLPYKIHLVLLFGLSILSSVLNLAPALVFQIAIDDYILKKDLNGLYLILFGLFLLGLLLSVQSFFQQKLSTYIGQSMVRNLRDKLFDHISHLPFEYFDQTTTGDVVARITMDTDQLTQFINQGLVGFIINLFMLIGMFTIAMIWNYRIGILFIGLFPLLFLSMNYFNKRILPLYQQIRKFNSNLTASIQQCFNGIREVKLYGREQFMTETFQKWNQDYYESTIQANKLSSFWGPFVPLLLNLFSVLFVLMGTFLIITANFTIGDLVGIITYYGMIGGSIRAVTGFANTYNSGKAAADRVFEIMDKIPSIQDKQDSIPLPQIQGQVQYDHVHFKYNRTEILTDINLNINPGETCAVVGPSGVGKTTLVHLLPRFYDITQGAVRIDGLDVRDIKLASLRKNVGIVMQNVFLFDGTIGQNIAYGKADATFEEIQHAAQIAQLADFIETLPEQYNTRIGERGVKLSGGQAQRLSIARVLITDPKLLILDEPTANVDAITDLNLIQAVQEVMKGRTTIIIAHRLWTIKNANKIVVLKDGQIDSQGTHEELLQKSPFYLEFFASQFLEEPMENQLPGGG